VLLLHYFYEQLQHGAVPAVQLLRYCYDNYNTRRERRATTTLVLRQLQHAAVPAVLLLHYCYDNYNTLPCKLCF